MTAARPRRWDAWMVEVVRGASGHPDLLHHVTRAFVRGRGEGDNFVEVKAIEGLSK
jgi:hypothetical protein